ncbi:hypothetical protein V1512DRAFT_230694 [Lipomyces arxii]|uniref:uncharacterized protein n=1 Tax=Lipomyces arxii TaxID=56418 RepID=UPI0034CD533E
MDKDTTNSNTNTNTNTSSINTGNSINNTSNSNGNGGMSISSMLMSPPLQSAQSAHSIQPAQPESNSALSTSAATATATATSSAISSATGTITGNTNNRHHHHHHHHHHHSHSHSHSEVSPFTVGPTLPPVQFDPVCKQAEPDPVRAEDAVAMVKALDVTHSMVSPDATVEIKHEFRTVTVKSDDVVSAANAIPSKNLGSLVYSPTPARQVFLPRLQDNVNSILDVRIPRRFMSRHLNPHANKREIWGTDVYTDDSDIVAVLYHLGHLPPPDDVTGDCIATIRVLPTLERYQGLYRNGMNSRSWLSGHDGVSYKVDKVVFVSRGKAEDRGFSMKKRRLDEWRIQKNWTDEKYGGEHL